FELALECGKLEGAPETAKDMNKEECWSKLALEAGQDDITIGSPIANRNHQQIETLIGFFVNTLAVRIDLSEDSTVCQLLELVRNTALDAQAHQIRTFRSSKFSK
ncbi:hypothetical protein BGZ65_001183, partial [Modicella reniformis]